MKRDNITARMPYCHLCLPYQANNKSSYRTTRIYARTQVCPASVVAS